MKVTTPQILFHGGDSGGKKVSCEPVFSLDFAPTHVRAGNDAKAEEKAYLLATAGADKDVKLWRVSGSPLASESADLAIAHVATLSGHNKTANCVRFAPSGRELASAGDGGEVLLWQPGGVSAYVKEQQAEATAAAAAAASVPPNATSAAPAVGAASASASAAAAAAGSPAAGGEQEQEWKVSGTLRGHADDVQDIAWNADGSALLTGSVENVAFVFDVANRKAAVRLSDHRGYVQGVAWDPGYRYLVTQSGDRTVRIYQPKSSAGDAEAVLTAAVDAMDIAEDDKFAEAVAKACGLSSPQSALNALNAASRGPFSCVATIAKRDAADVDAAAAAATTAAAAAATTATAKQPSLFAGDSLHSFFRRPAWTPDGGALIMPAGMVAGGVSATWLLRRGDATPAVALPVAGKPPVAVRCAPVIVERQGKRCALVAVATVDTLVVYAIHEDGEVESLAALAGAHLSALTDVAWAADAGMLAVSSHDGYITLVAFEEGELGRPMAAHELPRHVQARMCGFACRVRARLTRACGTAAAAAATAATAATAAATTTTILAEKRPAAPASAVDKPVSKARRITPIAVV